MEVKELNSVDIMHKKVLEMLVEIRDKIYVDFENRVTVGELPKMSGLMSYLLPVIYEEYEITSHTFFIIPKKETQRKILVKVNSVTDEIEVEVRNEKIYPIVKEAF